MKDVMLDFETLGTRPNCKILSVGMVQFDLCTGRIGEKLHLFVNPDTQEFRTVDQSTVDFWDMHDKGIRARAAAGNDYASVACEMWSFVNRIKGATLWANAANFDIPIFDHIMYENRKKPPYTFYKTRCVRSLHGFCKELTGIDVKKCFIVEEAHDALADCLYQIQYCVEAYRLLKTRELTNASN